MFLMNERLNQSEFQDIYVHGDGPVVFCYRSGMTVYEEVYADGRYMAAGWNAAGYTLNVLESFPTRFAGYKKDAEGKDVLIDTFADAQAFALEADGVSLDGSFQYIGFHKEKEIIENTDAAVLHGRVTLRSRVKPIEVVIHTVLDGTPVMTRWMEVKNLSDQSVNISAISPMCGGVEVIDRWKSYMKGAPDPSKIYSLGYMDQSLWGHEGFFKWHDLPNAMYGFSSKYRYDRFRHPFFVLKNKLLGTVMIAQLGWSGGYRFEFYSNTDSDTAKLSFQAALEAPNPMLVLFKGETFSMPAMHIGMLFGDLDDAVNSMHCHIRRSVFTQKAPLGKKGWIESGMGAERIMDVAATKHFADTAAAVGAETLIIDAGWNCPLGKEQKEWFFYPGDWYPDAERYPNGIGEIRDYIHSKGLKFGLWAEVESLGTKSKIRAEHPEWIAKCYSGQENRLLNMAIPEAAAWVESEIARMIEEYGLDLFRLDYNGSYRLMLCSEDKNGLPENTHLRYYQNTNAMFERLRRRFPDVIFENCASGGGRTDVGFVKNFTHTWVSDWNVAPRSFAITNGMTMVLPPECVDRLFSGMNCHTRGSLDFQVRNTLFGRPTCNDFNAVGSAMNPEQIAFVKHSFALYQTYIRPYIDDSKIYHHTPELVSGHYGAGGVVDEPQGVGVIERASGDKKCGVIGIFKLADSDADGVIHVYPKGIDASANYKVTFDNDGASAVVSGFSLKNDGLRISLSGSVVSELIVYERAEA